ncbi:MAG: LLM class flavin-dependent oxidoreductase [Dehalococcoidia bacterium]|nr:LLM class flavin-dependent oxidoreductase [Dehalococcoidia bacterium]MDW8120288.1 LLM class flavin-dependent oxidoreductase [Chloroflexota bacterium]
MPILGLAVGTTYPLKTILAVAEEADRLGYHSFWCTEGAGKDSITQLTACALHTQHILLGTGIVNIYSRTPLLLAMTASALQEASGGRFLLGLGSGHREPISQGHGIPFSQPLGRMEDYLVILRGLLKGETVSHEGKVVQVRGARLPVPPPIPPRLFVAALSPGMASLAGRLADGALFYLMPPAYVRELTSAMRLAAREGGRLEGEVVSACYLMAGEGDRAGEEVLRRSVARYATLPFYARMLQECGFAREVEAIHRVQGDTARMAQAVSDTMLDALTVTTTPGWLRRVTAYRQAGVDWPILFLMPSGPEVGESLLGMARRFAEGLA